MKLKNATYILKLVVQFKSVGSDRVYEKSHIYMMKRPLVGRPKTKDYLFKTKDNRRHTRFPGFLWVISEGVARSRLSPVTSVLTILL